MTGANVPVLVKPSPALLEPLQELCHPTIHARVETVETAVVVTIGH
jgi:hypothetical protein